LALVAAALAASTAFAQKPGGIIAAFNTGQNYGDDRRVVQFYNADDPSAPLFGAFVGFDELNNYDDPTAMTVDPLTGNVYVGCFDTGTPNGGVTTMTAYDTNGDGTGSPIYDTDGDIDLLKIDFVSIYNEWAANSGGAYVTYYGKQDAALVDDGFGGTQQPVIPGEQANPMFIGNGAIDKVGEVARSNGGFYFNRRMAFMNDDTILMLDAQAADGSTDPADDVQIRILERVSTSPGISGASGSGNKVEGGYNLGTSESWESRIVGNLQSDFSAGLPLTASEPEAISGVISVGSDQGFFFGESDGGGVNQEFDPNGDPTTDADNDGDEYYAPRSDDLGFYKLIDTNSDNVPDDAVRLAIDQGLVDAETDTPMYLDEIRFYDDPTSDLNANTADGKWTTGSENIVGHLPADFNYDRTVDGGDFAILSANWEQTGDDETGDATGDGTVDGGDFAVLSARWEDRSMRPADGSFDHIFVDEADGKLVIVESNIFDNDASGNPDRNHPAILTVDFIYDAVNDRIVIDNGTWTMDEITSDPSAPHNFDGDNTGDGNSDGYVFPNDSGETGGVEYPLDGRYAVYDAENDLVYFVEDDEDVAGSQLGMDIYVYDLVNGVMTAAYMDVEESFNLFDSDDFTEYMDTGSFVGSLSDLPASGQQPVPEPATLAVLGLGGLALLRRRRR
jgi:hypothetical protein